MYPPLWERPALLQSKTLVTLLPSVLAALKTNLDIMLVFGSLCFFFAWLRLVVLDALNVPAIALDRQYGEDGSSLTSGWYSVWGSAQTGSFPGEMLQEFSRLRWTGVFHITSQLLLCTVLLQFLLAAVMEG